MTKKAQDRRPGAGQSDTKIASPAAPRTIDVVSRLSAPTTLAYELGVIAYITAVAPLLLLAFHLFGRR